MVMKFLYKGWNFVNVLRGYQFPKKDPPPWN